jgi:hypothetical protein
MTGGCWVERILFLGVPVLVKARRYRLGPAGPPGACYLSRVLSLSGACGHLDAGLKCLVQTGLDLKSPFNSNGFRPRRKPDWPVYWHPCRERNLLRISGTA